jgi:hypothetical protein
MSKQAGQTARQAVAIIEKYGWNQGGWTGVDGQICIRGAFNVVAYGIVAMGTSPEEQEFTEWMAELGVLPDNAAGNPCLAGWNDEEDRTEDEVLAYLNKFAEEHDPQPVLP